jgi:hypothetical protein
MQSQFLKPAMIVGAMVLGGAAWAQQTDQAAKSITVKMSGANEVPGPGDADGTGTAMLKFDTAKSQICYDLKVSGIGAANGAHIHAGATGKAGDVKVPLETPDAKGAAKSCATVDPAVLKEILANPAGYYVNVHTAEYPNGAVRGQLTK